MFQRHILEDSRAICLDGSPAGFYYAASTAADSTIGNTWVIGLEGGGWCYNAAQCRWRARHALTGSSKAWPAEMELQYGPLSASPDENPDFYQAHRVTHPTLGL
jgi:hypothetical protein